MKYEMINHRDGEKVEADRLIDLVEYMENYNLTDNWITIKENKPEKRYKVLRNGVEGPDQIVFRTIEEAEKHLLWWKSYNNTDELTIKEIITGTPE